MNLAISILTTLVLFLVLFFFQSRPILGQQSKDHQLSLPTHPQKPIFMSLKLLLCDKDFLFSTLAHSIAIGHFFAFTTVLEAMIIPFGFTSIDASYLSTAYQASGIISGFLCSWVLTRKGPRYFKAASLTVLILTLISKLAS
jgi:hypothetical protein